MVHRGEMWVKALDAETFTVENVDWTTQYGALLEAAACGPRGYMVHESGRWSEEHEKWVFFPRKLSREPYDEVVDEAKCCNLMLACGSDFDAASTIAQPAALEFLPLRGCSDFLYIPGTRDSHLFVIRTEETLAGDVNTFCSVIDIAGTVLMPEIMFAPGRKFEGTCLVGEFLRGAALGAAAEAKAAVE